MKKFLTLVVALVMVIPMMAIGRNDGSTKANAIDFDWNNPMTHEAGTKWYHVDLAPLYEEETPALNLFLANKDAFNDTHTSLKATVAGQTDEKMFTIHPKQQRVWSANATMLIRLKQKEIYLTLTSDGPVMMSARVFEAQDLDETCTDALNFSWASGITKPAGVPVWYKLNIREARERDSMDVCVVVANNGTGKLTLYAGQSLDCPSSGVTKRTIELAAGDTLRDTIANSMLKSVAFDELYVSLENDQPISVKAEYAKRPPVPVMPADTGEYVEKIVPNDSLYSNDTTILLAGMTYYFKYDVTKLNALKKYEPEFTFRNFGMEVAKVDRKMSFEVPAYVAQGNVLELGAGNESVEVIAKNTLLAMDNSFIYVMIKSDKDVQLISRFKHIREGKACKTNIDFNWEGGHRQEAKMTQWYAVDLTVAKKTLQDVVVYINNASASKASVGAALAFSCPYIDLQEISRPIAAGDTLKHRMAYSTYAMMTDTVWVSINTDQDIKFWAEMVPTTKKAEVDTICMNAVDFNWDQGALQHAGDTVWYRINMKEVREKAAKFPTVFVQNLSNTNAANITAELSLECPDSIENQKRSMTIAAKEFYSKQLSRNMFENIKKDTIYLKVITTQDISLQIRLTEEAEGASCSSAIPFNWVSGNTQAANSSFWYSVDLRDVMKRGNDIRLHIENKENTKCKGVAQLLYECPSTEAPSIQDFTLAKYDTKSITVQSSAFDMVEDSMVYVNVQGTTALRFWVDTLPVKHFDTIYADDITLIPLHWDSMYIQNVDTAWYIISKEEIEKIRNSYKKVKPVAHLINETGAKLTIKGEAAFAFPITKKMMTKTLEIKANQHYTDTIPAGTFDQFLKKDSIIIRVTLPKGTGGSGIFRFGAELVSAYSGNSRYDALPVRLDETYYQQPMTSMWYRINTADLKSNPDLFNKRLRVETKNFGDSDATVRVAVYEGLLSDVDLLEDYGLGDYRERTIKKGESRVKNFPAQAIYAVGDVDLFVEITTDQKLGFGSSFSGTYGPITPDPKQAEAKLLVPNVEYIIPNDGEEHWYMVCIPYLQNNYIYSDNATLQYELNGAAEIEVTATLQDVMDCDMPVRKRIINKEGDSIQGTKPLRELIEKAIKKAGYTFDFTGTDPQFMDSLLHRYITKDSITAYVRIKTDNELKVKLNLEQITGDNCSPNPMPFDWEHGNVNPAGADTWYHVRLDSIIIPDTCDLRLHVDNWTNEEDSVNADLYFECGKPKVKGKSYTLAADGKDSLDIDRDFMRDLGWADMIINFYSEKATHIWAELIPDIPRDTLRDTITAYVCQGDVYTDTITHEPYTIDSVMTWNDTIEFKDGVRINDSITTFIVKPLVLPQALTTNELDSLGLAPLLVQGMDLFTDSSNLYLTQYYRQMADTVDTIVGIDTIYWAMPKYTASGKLKENDHIKLEDLDSIPHYGKTDMNDSLVLVIKSDTMHIVNGDTIIRDCSFTGHFFYLFTIDEYKYIHVIDTVCPKDTADYPKDTTVTVIDTLHLNRDVDTVRTFVAKEFPTMLKQDEIENLPTSIQGGDVIDEAYLGILINSLPQQFEDSADLLTMDVDTILWEADSLGTWRPLPFTVADTATSLKLHYIIYTGCEIDSTSQDIILSVTPVTCVTVRADTIDTVSYCSSYTWREKVYTETGTYYDTVRVGGCDSAIYTLILTFDNVTIVPAKEVTSYCSSYTWRGKDYTTAGTYYDTVRVGGCDSAIFVLDLTFKDVSIVPAEDVTSYCDSFIWRNKVYKEAGTYYDTVRVGGCDSARFTLNLAFAQAKDTTEDVTTYCSSYTWHGKDYTTAGIYHDTVRVDGCDSARFTLNLAFAQAKDTTEDVTTYCSSYTWHGKDYTTAGIYHDTVRVDGCDSARFTLNLTFEQAIDVTAEDVTSYCDSYTWRNKVYTESGTYHDTVRVDGCDSARFTLNLSMVAVEEVAADVVTTYCDSYTWRNKAYTESGIYHDTVRVNGCDSARFTLDLTLNTVKMADVDSIVICDSVYTWRTKDYEVSGTYYDTIRSNVDGCDSIIYTLKLALLSPKEETIKVTECNMYTWPLNGVTYIKSGVYKDTLINGASNGCDSIVTLNLTINVPYEMTLSLVSKYGDRLLMINRKEINDKGAEWHLDLETDTVMVSWYKEGTPDKFLGYGYYYTMPNGAVLDPGTYYAKLEIPAMQGAECGAKGETVHYTVKGGSAAPALVPTLARPGETIRVINLDPEQTTTIRIYTTEGILRSVYTVSGEESFSIKAADANGYYLVELSNDGLQSTLRFIVK